MMFAFDAKQDFARFALIYYVVAWGAARVRGGIRRWRQPLLRGAEWFFNVHVQDGFYAAEGKRLLRDYRLRMMASFVLELPVALFLIATGRYLYLMLLVLVMILVVHVAHVYNVDYAERQARPFAVPEAEQPVASVALSLKTRRLRDYSNRALEIVIALASVGTFAWLLFVYLTSAPRPGFAWVFGRALLYLYVQLGFLLVKLIVLAWRSPVPRSQAEEYLQAREEQRSAYLRSCDINRVIVTIALVACPFLLKLSPQNASRYSAIGTAAAVALGLALLAWQEIRRKRLLQIALRVRPVRFPDLLSGSAPGWPVCFQPSVPMLVLKGARGYSLNLANSLAQWSAAYLAGLAVLLALLQRVY
jgi:hypothetical protein